ncbi:MAG: YciI family protein, partial [Isosphaeraceae bacterium]
PHLRKHRSRLRQNPERVEGGELSPRFAYVYFMTDDPVRVRAAVPGHVSHWQALRLDGYLGGPFEDHSGGLITFEAEDEEHASRAVNSDPFVVNGLLETYWLKRWTPE